MLDAASIAAITQEARNCFLYEDAPDYLTMLDEGLAQLRIADQDPNFAPEQLANVYKELGRAVHSLKGGSGLAQLPTLNDLAHKMEDMLQVLEQKRIKDHQTAVELLTLGYEQVRNLIDGAIARGSTDINPEQEDQPQPLEITAALEEFLDTLEIEEGEESTVSTSGEQKSDFVKTALRVDLEDCLQRVEKGLSASNQAKRNQQLLNTLVEECTLLGQALNLAWLVEVADLTQRGVKSQQVSLKKLAKVAIADIRRLRQAFLTDAPEQDLKPVKSLRQFAPRRQPQPQSQPSAQPQATPASKPQGNQPDLNLRIPIDRLNRMSDTVGELIITHEQLLLSEAQLQRANRNLKKRTQQLDPLRDQVQSLYDHLAITGLSPERDSLSPRDSTLEPTQTESSLLDEFDPLQFDQYSSVHTTLQQFQELMVQVQETREDIDLVSREFQESLVQLRQQLDSLHSDLTESRLVRFGSMAGRFIAPLQTLSQRHNKEVRLQIKGEEVLVDQAVLEQLQTPLTHLLRNAFDHGIEMPQERVACQKSRVAQIELSAVVRSNQVIITITDDGRGINPQKVYQRAREKGLCPPQTSYEQLSKEEILDFLFTPGFSTAEKVTSLSGRGMGLDIVRLQVERLRGSLTVESALGKGSEFMIQIPLTLNILPLLLCRCQQLTLALPSANMKELLELGTFDLDWTGTTLPQVQWQGKTLTVYPLYRLLPYQQPGLLGSTSQLRPPESGIIVDVSGQLIVIAVDAIAGERELVLKSFDQTIPVPPYVAGCTVLGTGEVISVLSPDYFTELLKPLQKATGKTTEPLVNTEETTTSTQPSVLIVDDSIAVRRSLNRLLTAGNFQVTQARDGQEALNILNSPDQTFDLVLCDIEMPVLDGFSLLQSIRSEEKWQNLPVAMLTSRESELHRNKAMSLGATTYFTKPFHPVDLLEAVTELIKDS